MTVTGPTVTGPHLERGKHHTPDEGMCLMEAVSYLAGEPFTDSPSCVSPLLAQFGRTLNDSLDYDRRQRLVPLIPKLIGTVDDGKDESDSARCAHWVMAHWLPAWLDHVPELAGQAAKLRAAPAPESSPSLARWETGRGWVPLMTAVRDAAIAVRGALDGTVPAPQSVRFTLLTCTRAAALDASGTRGLYWLRGGRGEDPLRVAGEAAVVACEVVYKRSHEAAGQSCGQRGREACPHDDTHHSVYLRLQATAQQLDLDSLDLFAGLVEDRRPAV